MDPNNQNNQYPGAPQGNPYEFIMNPQQNVRRNPFGGSFLMKVVLIVGLGGLLMLIIGIIAVSMGGKNNSNEVLLDITQQQVEIRRVASGGNTTIRAQTVKNFGQTTSLTFFTDQVRMTNFLAKRGYKVEAKKLGLKRNPVTDQKLTAAQNASEFDQAYVQILQSEIKAYQASLQTAFKNTDSKTEKGLLTGFYNETVLLLEQSNLKG